MEADRDVVVGIYRYINSAEVTRCYTYAVPVKSAEFKRLTMALCVLNKDSDMGATTLYWTNMSHNF